MKERCLPLFVVAGSWPWVPGLSFLWLINDEDSKPVIIIIYVIIIGD